MPEPEQLLDVDFDAQMRGLFEEAEQVLEERSAAARNRPETAGAPADAPPQATAAAPVTTDATPSERAPSEPSIPKAMPPTLPQMLRPMVLGFEALTRATGENTAILQKLDQVTGNAAEAQADLPQLVGELRQFLEQKNGVNQRMFDALHEELKGYKDGFLLESVHRPIIRDMITVYDDLAEIHRQLAAAASEPIGTDSAGPGAEMLVDRIRRMELNVEHNLEFILEVLARLEVTPMAFGVGKLDKRTQRAVAVELAEDPDQDTDIVRTVKRGFLWKERVLRAEEIVMKKWKEGFLVALAPAQK